MIGYEEALKVLRDLKAMAETVDMYEDDVIEDYRYLARHDNREIIETLLKLDLNEPLEKASGSKVECVEDQRQVFAASTEKDTHEMDLLRFEKLKWELFNCGQEVIEDFLGYEIDPDEDRDVIERRMDMVYEQIPEDVLEAFYQEYGIGLVADLTREEILLNQLETLGVDCSKFHIFHLNQVGTGGYPDGIKYWSNSVGELQDPSGYDIHEEEIPEGLEHAYFEISPFERFGSYCRLVETGNGFGLAMVNEYDECFAEDVRVSLDDLFLYAAKDAERISGDPLFETAEIFLEERAGVFGCHELIVVVPADITKDTFERIAKRLDELVYQSAYELESGSLEHLVQNAEQLKGEQKIDVKERDLEER